MIPKSSHGYGTHFVEKVNSSQNSGCEFVAFQSLVRNRDEQFNKLQQQMVHKFSKNLGAT
jgi:putative N-acetylmannosamine-6-phosphate epimerase